MVKEIKIEVTEQCQRWCAHCSSKAKDIEFQYLNKELVKRIIDEAVLLKANSVVFTGGEATLYPNLEESISYAHQNGLETKLYTMCNPNEESIRHISNFVFYGLDEMIYSTSYHLTRDGVVSLAALQDFFPKLLKKSSVRLGFHHAVTKETVGDIEDIVKLFLSLPEEQMTKLSFLRFVPHGRGTKDLLLSKDQLLWFREKMIQYKQQYGDKIRLGSPWNFLGIEHTPCNAAEDSMIIGFDGNVYPCDAMKYFDYLGSGGNVYENSLEQIYHSKYFQEIRNFKQCASAECLKCKNYCLCKGGCLGQKMVDFMDDSTLTFKSYGNQAKRTMNHFANDAIKKMNGEMGIVGEIGELIDSFKKYKTHDLELESKQKLLQNLEIEIGDIVWYLAASLSSAYEFEFEDIGNYLFENTYSLSERQLVSATSILKSACRKDPECFYQENIREIPIAFLDQVDKRGYQFEVEWKQLIRYAYNILFASSASEVLQNCSLLLVSLTRIASFELDVSMEQVLIKNIEKLKQRYQKGFDSHIASSRIELLTSYKQSEPSFQKVYQ